MTDKPSGDRIRESLMERAEKIAYDPLLPLPGELTRNRLQVEIEQMAKQVRDEAIEEAAKAVDEAVIEIQGVPHRVCEGSLSKMIRSLKTSVSKEGSKESRGKA